MFDTDLPDFSVTGFAAGFALGLPFAVALDNFIYFPVFGSVFGIAMAIVFAGENKKD